jgi:XTP/dITP diphosphohydrolase
MGWPTKLVVATHNPGKLEEFRALLPGIELVSLTEAAPTLTDIPETGGTYLENATIKARAGAAASGFPSLGDDSGLEVDALDGAPGLYSARYSGGGEKLNVEKLLAALGDRPRAERTARFRCVLVVAHTDLSIALTATVGTCEGFIDFAPRGEHGFGYDPVFVPLDGQAGAERTLAEYAQAEKNAISHRGNACRALLKTL